jgi:membrane protease YdiL (CAAX protease family)
VLVPVVVASRRYGTGRIGRDYQLCWRGVDGAIGIVASFGVRLAAGIAAAVAIAATGINPRSFPSQLEVFADERAALLLAFAFAVLGAPIIEELFFRGLLQRSLQRSVGVVGAIAVQGALFGCAHMTAVATWQQNVVIATMLGTVGVGAGVLVHVTKRLAPAMWMHFFFNVVGVGIAAAQLL